MARDPMLQYPNNIRKYAGDIRCYGTRYEIKIRSIGYYTTVDTEEEAIEHLKQKNITLGLYIKNRLYKYEDHYECLLHNEKRMKFDYDDLSLVEKHIVYESSGYPVVRIKGKVFRFSHLLMPGHNNNTQTRILVHLNGDMMDCRRENLKWRRLISYFNDKDNERGVTKRQTVLRTGTIQCRYVAQWIDPYTDKKCSRSFGYAYDNKEAEEAAKQSAIAYRKKVLCL